MNAKEKMYVQLGAYLERPLKIKKPEVRILGFRILPEREVMINEHLHNKDVPDNEDAERDLCVTLPLIKAVYIVPDEADTRVVVICVGEAAFTIPVSRVKISIEESLSCEPFAYIKGCFFGKRYGPFLKWMPRGRCGSAIPFPRVEEATLTFKSKVQARQYLDVVGKTEGEKEGSLESSSDYDPGAGASTANSVSMGMI